MRSIHIVGDDVIANHIVIEDDDVLSDDKRKVLRNGRVSLIAPEGHVFAEDIGTAGPGWKKVDGKWTHPPQTMLLDPGDVYSQVSQRHRTAIALLPDINFGTPLAPRLAQTPTSADEMAHLALACFLAQRQPTRKFNWVNTHSVIELTADEVLKIGDAVAKHVQDSYDALAMVYADHKDNRIKTHTDIHNHPAWPGDKP
jgi:hypothetical protein